MNLKTEYLNVISKYTQDKLLRASYWEEIEKSYSSSKRYYHNLDHLQNMMTEFSPVIAQIDDYDVMVLALFYHDIVYKSTAKDNEEKSALLAGSRLVAANFPVMRIRRCMEMIRATQGHSIATDHQTNLFTDADLSILGKPWEVYEMYFRNIRKEYAIYPDFLYRPGRLKVLQHFMQMPRLFKTDHFFKLYEEQARRNLRQEQALLN